jgi:hypothetical protein
MSDRDELDWIKMNEPWRVDLVLEETPWWHELIKIKGIGKETAKDIGNVYPNMEELKKAVESNNLPFRNDIIKLLIIFFERRLK